MAQLNGVALCAGHGGLELGLRSVLGSRYRCVAYVERDAYAAATLVARMEAQELDSAPLWDDLRSYDGRWLRGGVDLVSAGFPCQPFSTASRGRRTAVDLWPHVLRVVRELAAPLVFCENVQREPIERACRDLARAGFRTWYTRTSSAELGAPHRRIRWWLFADADHAAQSVLGLDAEVARLRAAAIARWSERPDRVLGVDDGAADRVDRLRGLGNTAMPLMAAVAFARLIGAATQDHALGAGALARGAS